MVPLALGTQTGGSTIRPAAYCGIVGYKPSFNTVNRTGLKFVAESLDTIGLYGRSVDGRCDARPRIVGPCAPPTGWPDRRASVSFARSRWAEASTANRGNLDRIASLLAEAGAAVEAFDAPAGYAALYDLQNVVMGYESARALAWEYAHHRDQLSSSLLPRLEEGWRISRAHYDAAREGARHARRAFNQAIEAVDVLITPAAVDEAPHSLQSTGDSLFNRAWTLLGVPCVALPSGTGPHGLPLSVQVVGGSEGDAQTLARCGALDRARARLSASFYLLERWEFRCMAVTGSELVAQALARLQVKDFFFVMGAPMLGAEKACMNAGLRGIDVRHEQAAAMMAPRPTAA